MMCFRDTGDGSRCERPEGHNGICWPREDGPPQWYLDRLECYGCDGTGRRVDFMGPTPDPCEVCGGTGIRPCEECGDPAEIVVDGLRLCGGHADAYEREVAA